MLNRLLPRSLDNAYRGFKPALWIFGLVVLMRTVIAVNSIFNGYAVMTMADGIPLDTFAAGASQSLVSLWALMSVGNLTLSLLCIVALVRYRAMIPMLFSLLLFQLLARELVSRFLPLYRVGAPPASAINLTFLVLTVVGLALSLGGAGKLQRAE